MGNKRSPFSLNILELAIAIGTGIATWFGLHDVLWSIAPWPGKWEYYENEPLSLWFTEGRQEIFDLFAIPLAIFMAISAIFLLRGIRNQEIKFFSRISNLAIAWPIFSFIFLNILSFLSLYCLPIGMILAGLAFALSYESESKWGGIFAITWNIAWFFIGGCYFGHWWSVYGD